MSIGSVRAGNFQDTAGNPLAGGKLLLRLNAPAQIVTADGQIAQGLSYFITLDNTGNAPNPSPLWQNDQINPAGTFYTANLYSAGGALVRGPENWVIAGSSPVDLGGIIASTPSISYSGAVLLTPTAAQNIATFPLQVPALQLGTLADTGISRDSAGVVDVGNGVAGDKTGTLKAANFTASANISAANVTATANVTGANVNATTLAVTGQSTLANLNAANMVLSGQVTNYNSVATSLRGIPSVVASQVLTLQSTNITTTNLFTPTVNGYYRISFYATVTRAATTSSTLGGASGWVVGFTDVTDAQSVGFTLTSAPYTNSLNVVAGQIPTTGSVIVNAQASQPVTYAYGYASVGATNMQFTLAHIAEAL